MPTSTETILAGAKSEQVIQVLRRFFADAPERRGSLRLAALGVIDVVPDRDDPMWLATTQAFNCLFKGKLQQFRELPESRGKDKAIKRFVFRGDRADLDALLSMYVIHKVEEDARLIDRPFIKIAFTIDDTLNRVWDFLRRGGDDIVPVMPHDLGAVLAAMRRVLGAANDDSIRSWLFGSDYCG